MPELLVVQIFNGFESFGGLRRRGGVDTTGDVGCGCVSHRSIDVVVTSSKVILFKVLPDAVPTMAFPPMSKRKDQQLACWRENSEIVYTFRAHVDDDRHTVAVSYTCTFNQFPISKLSIPANMSTVF